MPTGGKQPILISLNDYETAIKSVVEGWQVYSMVRSANKESASEVLFRLLGFPEVKTDTDNNITSIFSICTRLRFTTTRQAIPDLRFGRCLGRG